MARMCTTNVLITRGAIEHFPLINLCRLPSAKHGRAAPLPLCLLPPATEDRLTVFTYVRTVKTVEHSSRPQSPHGPKVKTTALRGCRDRVSGRSIPTRRMWLSSNLPLFLLELPPPLLAGPQWTPVHNKRGTCKSLGRFRPGPRQTMVHMVAYSCTSFEC